MDVTASTFSANASTATSNAAAASETSQKKTTLDYDSFLKLLIAQLKYQDPTQPMDPAEHISQLASFSAVEQGVKTNSKLDALLTSFALSQADSVIGRTVTSSDGTVSGKAVSVRIIDGGAVATLDNGKDVTLGSGVRIS